MGFAIFEGGVEICDAVSRPLSCFDMVKIPLVVCRVPAMTTSSIVCPLMYKLAVLGLDGQDPSSEYSANIQLGLKPLENKLPNKQKNKQTESVHNPYNSKHLSKSTESSI